MKTVPVRRLAAILNGGTPTSDERNWGGGVPWATPVDLARVDGRVIASTDRTLTKDGLQSGSAEAPAGAVIVSTRAPIGYTARAEVPIAFNQGCKAVVGRAEVHPRFLQLALISAAPALKAAGSGSTFPELSSEALASQSIPMHPLEHQQRIADFLDDRLASIDQIIVARRVQSHAIRDARLSTLDELFRDAGPSQRLAWALRMGAVGVVVNPSSYFRNDGVPFIHGYNVRDGHMDLTDLKRMSAADSAVLGRSRLQVDDVLVVRAGYPGRAAVVTPDLVGGNCASVLLLRPSANLSPHWLAAFFNSPLGKSEVARAQYGAAQGVINLSDVQSFTVPLPARAEQERRLERFRMLEANFESGHQTIERQIDGLRDLRRSLISAAVNGELDVTTAGSGVPG